MNHSTAFIVRRLVGSSLWMCFLEFVVIGSKSHIGLKLSDYVDWPDDRHLILHEHLLITRHVDEKLRFRRTENKEDNLTIHLRYKEVNMGSPLLQVIKYCWKTSKARQAKRFKVKGQLVSLRVDIMPSLGFKVGDLEGRCDMFLIQESRFNIQIINDSSKVIHHDTTFKIWNKFEKLFATKNLQNKMYIGEKFFTFKMDSSRFLYKKTVEFEN
uniref:Uncharacterized protein n=1 Tax=Cucumis melo TaxID=3656 RepID=A0A9I9EIY5_CUCME